MRTIRGALERRLEVERDQLAHWPVVGLGLGIALWFAVPTRWGWSACISAALGLAIVARIASRDRIGRALALFLVALAIGTGVIWWRAERVAAPVLARPVVVALTGQVTRVERQPAEQRTRLTLAVDRLPDIPPLVRINVDDADMVATIAAGARVRVRVRLMPPAPPGVPGGYDFARTAWFQGLGATGKALGRIGLLAPAAAPGLGDRLTRWRTALTGHIQAQLAGSRGGIASALVTGDRGAIAEADSEAMQRAGLSHLLSISGLHVTAVVAGVMLATVRLFAFSPWLALRWPLPLIGAAAGALAGIAYTLLSGGEVPTIRSCIAALLVLAGLAIGREAITMRLVATGALVILLLWPESLAGPSFQLSFAAVTAIVALHEHPWTRRLFLRRDEGSLSRAGRGVLSLLVTGLVVEAALAPIAAFHFHKAGLYGALANIVAIPLTTFVIMPAEAAALLFDMAGSGAPFWWLGGQAIALLLGIAHRVAEAPGAVAALPSMPAGAFAAMAAGGLWVALWRTGWRRAGWLAVAIGATWTLLTPPPDLLMTGDGRHLALRRANGTLALLRPRAGDYVRDLLGEAGGSDMQAAALDAIPEARCSADFCTATIARGGKLWRVLATRSPYLVPIADLRRACASADIVVSERRLPFACRPRWLKVDRRLLERTGGLAVRLDPATVATVLHAPDEHPWRRAAQPDQ